MNSDTKRVLGYEYLLLDTFIRVNINTIQFLAYALLKRIL